MSCSLSGGDKSDDTKYIGKLDRDVSWDGGKRFIIKDNSYKIVTDNKGRRAVILVEDLMMGVDLATLVNENGCVTPENSNYVEVDQFPVYFFAVLKRKIEFKPNRFCFKIRKMGE